MTEKYQHLSPRKRESFLNIFKRSEDLFGASLGTWNTALVDLELKYDSKHVCLRPYTVPRVHKIMFRKEVERLVKIGVIKEANYS